MGPPEKMMRLVRPSSGAAVANKAAPSDIAITKHLHYGIIPHSSHAQYDLFLGYSIPRLNEQCIAPLRTNALASDTHLTRHPATPPDLFTNQ